MPPRGRGRGRMRFRARPPASVRSSMQELGLAAGMNYGTAVADATGAQVDAARAYFPALEAGPAPALRPTKKELELVVRFEKIRATMRASPASVRPRSRRQPKLVGELARARDFFCAQLRAREEATEGLWHTGRPWFVPELLPMELRGSGGRDGGNGPVRGEVDFGGLGVEGEQATEGEKEAGEKDDGEGEGEGEQEVVGSEEDDLALNADYETGARFDDDDGYEEADSGNEEAIF